MNGQILPNYNQMLMHLTVKSQLIFQQENFKIFLLVTVVYGFSIEESMH